jgi:hypothetical protein
MTIVTAQRLYDFYIKTKQLDRAEEMAARRPVKKETLNNSKKTKTV